MYINVATIPPNPWFIIAFLSTSFVIPLKNVFCDSLIPLLTALTNTLFIEITVNMNNNTPNIIPTPLSQFVKSVLVSALSFAKLLVIYLIIVNNKTKSWITTATIIIILTAPDKPPINPA